MCLCVVCNYNCIKFHYPLYFLFILHLKTDVLSKFVLGNLLVIRYSSKQLSDSHKLSIVHHILFCVVLNPFSCIIYSYHQN